MGAHRFPSLEQVYDEIERLVEEHGQVARVECLGLSDEGREVRAVHVTDPGAGDDDKQVAMIVCGRHGSELGTRVVGTAALGWLVSDEAAPTRQRQHVIVVPVANPDGCAAEAFGAPPWHLSATERRTLGRVAGELRPDAILDVHSFGAEDADLLAVVTGNNTEEAEDRFIYGTVAARLVETAGGAGYPFVVHTEKRNEGYNNFIAGLCYDQFHSLSLGMEANHHVLTPEGAAAAGLAVVRALLAEGDRRAPWEACTGYPTGLLRGDFFTSIRPAGPHAAARRRSRATVWRDRRFFHLGRRQAPSPNVVRTTVHYSGDPQDAAAHAFTLCCRVRGSSRPARVELNGQRIDADIHRDVCSTYVSAAVQPTGPQTYELVVTS